jgi:hypothetical protein
MADLISKKLVICSNRYIKEKLQTKFKPNYPSGRLCVSSKPIGNILYHKDVREHNDNMRYGVLPFRTQLNESHAQLQPHTKPAFAQLQYAELALKTDHGKIVI